MVLKGCSTNTRTQRLCVDGSHLIEGRAIFASEIPAAVCVGRLSKVVAIAGVSMVSVFDTTFALRSVSQAAANFKNVWTTIVCPTLCAATQSGIGKLLPPTLLKDSAIGRSQSGFALHAGERLLGRILIVIIIRRISRSGTCVRTHCIDTQKLAHSPFAASGDIHRRCARVGINLA